MFKPKELILTAGPSISPKEINYVTDAVKNGWNFHMLDYKDKLEKKFVQYTGAKYAEGISGATGAMLLALASLKIGPGDEVILPDLCFYAASDVVMHRGAKPVFVDVLPNTWCIDPVKVKKVINKRTRAIIPVYMYGNLWEMEEIASIAKKYGLFIVEDAAPALGSIYKGKKPGTFGEFGAYSFQGAKIAISGIGGMMICNNKKLYERAIMLNTHGQSPKKKFWQIEVAYSFHMSNLQAALALAQLERIEEFVAKKNQIFSWYKSRLAEIDGISMNPEIVGTRSNKWMSSIVLNKQSLRSSQATGLKKFKFTRDQLIRQLRKHLIDARPFFYPVSMFPMYKEQNTPVAHHLGLNGINLPSGVNLDKQQVDYICDVLIKLLS